MWRVARISTKIKIDVVTIHDYALETQVKGMGEIKRLICYGHIKKQEEESMMNFIFDTGAHTTLIPRDWWIGKDVEIIGNHKLEGLISRKGCDLSVKIGKVKLKLIDKEGNETPYFEIKAYLANINNVPLLLGLRDLPMSTKIHLDIINNNCYFEF